ncbi:protein phosphatase 2C domain-containing protein [Kibdelosporangium philippinense]|uniref:Protein phosphatase 2C domain-containing protein n=1 Tax=Kibdelosporangium philippinense TaxID=211113 RepID=A0ABS8ZJ08_9PSEU|nr:protein phosphatase 2C domain-containing protein [Kibdelosporangium philippinense]MCE7007492.1 protein phosphatase 2C domain-containing protein [Kibdelosporangium philippinense]
MHTACVECGGVVAPDGHCWECGAVQPRYRAHIELAVKSGAAAVTDRGLRRGINADAMALLDADPWTIGVVCDGVSMSPRPERAAQVAAATASQVLATELEANTLPEAALEKAAARASQAVSALGTPESAPACTYIAGIAGESGIWTSWIGDSRAYWIPAEGPAILLTEDDTGDLDALSNWLGADAPASTPHIRSLHPTTPGTFVLCTDGLWRYLPDAESIRHQIADSPEQTVQALVQHALDCGGHDNITAMVIPWPGRRSAKEKGARTQAMGQTAKA